MHVQSFSRFWVIAVLAFLLFIVPAQVVAFATQPIKNSEFASNQMAYAFQEPKQPVGIVNTGALNVRSGPGPEFSYVTVIYNGQVVSLLGRWATNNWVKVKLYSGIESWVNSTYLKTNVPTNELPILGGIPPTVTPTPPETRLIAIVATGALNVRSGPDVKYPSIEIVNAGQQLALLGRNGDGSWVKIRTQKNTEGWVNSSLVQTSVPVMSLPIVDGTPPTPTPTPPEKQPPTAVVTSGALNVRSGPGVQYSIVDVVYFGQLLSLLSRNSDGTWVEIWTPSNVKGWVNASLIQPSVSVLSLPVADSPKITQTAVITSGAANVRSGPGLVYDEVAVVYQGQTVTLLGRNANGSWLTIKLVNGIEGWSNVSVLRTNVPVQSLPVIKDPPLPNSAVVNVSTLTMRSGPGTNYSAITYLKWGQVVSMIGRSSNNLWVQVYLPNGATGWVGGNYLLGSVPISTLPVTTP